MHVQESEIGERKESLAMAAVQRSVLHSKSTQGLVVAHPHGGREAGRRMQQSDLFHPLARAQNKQNNNMGDPSPSFRRRRAGHQEADLWRAV
jgi:hypothetical protein